MRILIIEADPDILKIKAEQATEMIQKLKLTNSKCDFLYHDDTLFKLVNKGRRDA